MTITLYHTNDDPKKVSKTLSDASSEQYATLRDAVDILRPVLRIQKTVTLQQYNYAEIPAFGRYYFIESITVDRTGLSELQCVVDPLMSHKDELLSCPAVLSRSADCVNAYVHDPQLPFTVFPENSVLTFRTFYDPVFSFNYGGNPLKNMVLVTMG